MRLAILWLPLLRLSVNLLEILPAILLAKNLTGKLSMGRKRNHDKHLPRRMYLRRSSYYLVEASGKWVNLGQDFALAMANYGELVGASRRCATLGDVIERYRIDVLPQKAAKTQKEQGRQLDRIVSVFGELRPKDITPQYIYRYLDSRLKTPTAARHEISLLGHVFNKAIRWGAASTNPVQLIEKPQTRPRDRYVTDDEYLAVYNLASERIQIAMDLALLTGLRRGDLLSLTRGQLTEDESRRTMLGMKHCVDSLRTRMVDNCRTEAKGGDVVRGLQPTADYEALKQQESPEAMREEMIRLRKKLKEIEDEDEKVLNREDLHPVADYKDVKPQ